MQSETLKGKGYYYIVYGGGKHFREVTRSVESLLNVNPNARITVVSSRPSPTLESKCERVIVDVDLDFRRSSIGKQKVRGLQGKTRSMASFIPYEKTCFVDGDTYWCESPENAFSLLNFFDVLACPDPGEIEIRSLEKPHTVILGLVPPNLGLVFYTVKSKQLWEDIYKYQQELPREAYFPEYHGQAGAFSDQPYFADRLMRDKSLRYYPLPTVWNFQWRKWQTVQGTVKLIHGRASDYQVLKRKINGSSDLANRMWNPVKQQVLISNSFVEFIP